MCRLMGFASATDTSIRSIAGSNFSQFAQLSLHHKDGWGFATENELTKEVLPAKESASFESVVDEKESAALLHFRLASPGLPVQESNSHPFIRDGISFIHNGAVKPPDAIDFLIAPDLLGSMTGTTDSERYFFAILTAARTHELPEALVETVRAIRQTGKNTSLNAMVLSERYFVVVAEYDNAKIPAGEPADYYQLFYRHSDGGVVVASSGWNQDGWTELPNHTAMVVDRKTLESSFISI